MVTPSEVLIDAVVRKPYTLVHLPLIARIYKFGFDNTSLANPRLFQGYKTPFRILSRLILPKLQQSIVFRYKNNNCVANSKNTQFHSIYFDKFIEKGYETDVCALLDILIKKDGVFYDIGANWGYFCGYVSSNKKFNGTIIAFEPQSAVFDDLKTFIYQAKLDGLVRPFQVALSDINCMGTISVSDSFHSGLGKLSIDRNGKNSIFVKKLDEMDLPKPDLIKIDAEGEEVRIINGSLKILAAHKPFIIYENHEFNNKLIFDVLQKNNYVIFSLDIEKQSIVDHNIDLKLKISKLSKENTNQKSKNNFACHIDRLSEFFTYLN